MKRKLFVMLLLAVMLFSGCGKSREGIKGAGETAGPEISVPAGEEPQAETEGETGEEIETEGEAETTKDPEEETEAEEETASQEHYKRESESGKVKFDCRIEVPDAYKNNSAPKLMVTGQSYGEEEKILSKYAEGKEIEDTYEGETHDGIPAGYQYSFTDGSGVGWGDSFICWTGNASYYHQAGVSNSDNWEEYCNDQVSAISAQEAMEGVRQELAEAGFSEFDFQLVAYPVSHKTMQRLEKAAVADWNEGIDDYDVSEEEKEEMVMEVKETWTQEDDAYVVYGYQLQDSLPIYHQWMAMFRSIAYDNVTNAPVTAIYSGRGVEELMVNPVYYFENTGDTLALKEFEEIAGVVEEKFENLLDDKSYVVKRARLFQMVRLDESQENSVEPVWYFEVAEDETTQKVTLIDAVTGKLIF